MQSFKRQQVEEAIGRANGEPSGALRTRTKRLLEADRNLGRNPSSSKPYEANFAFFSSDAPGRGVDVTFSPYEAFALDLALRLLDHRWPQSFPLTVLRSLRPELELEHTRMLRQDPAVLFNQDAIQRLAQEGALYFDNTDPVFLTIVSRHRLPGSTSDLAYGVCRGLLAVSRFAQEHEARSTSLLELVTPAHRLADELAQIEPRKRGRG